MNSTMINEIERDGKTYRFKEMKATFNCDKCDLYSSVFSYSKVCAERHKCNSLFRSDNKNGIYLEVKCHGTN